MLFKVLVLGHVLLASAFETKALHELQADVDTLEKTLKSGDDLEKKMMPTPAFDLGYSGGAGGLAWYGCAALPAVVTNVLVNSVTMGPAEHLTTVNYMAEQYTAQGAGPASLAHVCTGPQA